MDEIKQQNNGEESTPPELQNIEVISVNQITSIVTPTGALSVSSHINDLSDDALQLIVDESKIKILDGNEEGDAQKLKDLESNTQLLEAVRSFLRKSRNSNVSAGVFVLPYFFINQMDNFKRRIYRAKVSPFLLQLWFWFGFILSSIFYVIYLGFKAVAYSLIGLFFTDHLKALIELENLNCDEASGTSESRDRCQFKSGFAQCLVALARLTTILVFYSFVITSLLFGAFTYFFYKSSTSCMNSYYNKISMTNIPRAIEIQKAEQENLCEILIKKKFKIDKIKRN